MDQLPLTFFDDLPSSPLIQAATDRIRAKIQLGQGKYEDGLELSEVPSPHWADENELKSMIEFVHTEEENAEDQDLYKFKIRLMETNTIHLFEMPSVGYCEGTAQANEALFYNEMREKYENRKTKVQVLSSNGSCQTEVPLLLRKCIQTKKIISKDIGCTVTEWDMMDSFKKLDRQYRKKYRAKRGEEKTCTERFLMASQVVERLMSSNNFHYQQLLFTSPPCELGKSFKYTLQILWKMKEALTGEVNNICTNPFNKRLTAVGYGDRGGEGCICIWNAKNPQTPEKKILLCHAVTCTKFSNETPYNLAAVTEAGDVLIVNVRHCTPQVKVISSAITNIIKRPLWHVSWFVHKDLQKEQEKIITVGDSGVVTLWNPIDATKTELARLTYNMVPHEGMFVHQHSPGSSVDSELKFSRSTFQVVDIELDPSDEKTYYASSTQGALLVCKTSAILGPPTPVPAHRGAVLGMRHSPAVPKVYLTYGADAKTLLWVHGVKSPITTLATDSLDPILCALWSPSHCSVILTIDRKHLCIWDIRRSVLDPMTILFVDEGAYFTTALFNDMGTVVFVGLNDGTVTAYNLHEMPHPPYLQRNHLLAAFKKILWRNKTLFEEVNFILNN